MTPHQRKISALVSSLVDWFSQKARDLPWRRTRDPYAIWVSEIMLQQTQVKTVLPFWERWMRELPTIEAVAHASSDKIHKLWEGLGYYHRVRNLQKAAQMILEKHDGKFPEKFEDVLALPGIGRYTAGAICSIAFNQPTPILDGNVMRVLTRVFGIEKDPREKETNQLLWRLAEDLVSHAKEPRGTWQAKAPRDSTRQLATRAGTRKIDKNKLKLELQPSCSHLNQSLMELGALVCTPRNPQCVICPVKRLCVAFKTHRVAELPNLGKRAAATARRFMAFVVEHRGKFLVRQRPEDVVNAHLWEFPNVELNGHAANPVEVFKSRFGFAPPELLPLPPVKHSITRYRITLEAFRVPLKAALKTPGGTWLAHSQFDSVAFTAAHKKLANFEVNRILAGR
ncbi:MAG TPA: A/G-specific adenine glycosylase [Candidatus Acidoferrum sp.]|nr:A/G-specific adenine glycosylase [Candidatus Acidoferrum sp.]